MMRLRPFVVVLLSLLLLGAQQAAFAHMIGHIGHAAATVQSLGEGDDGHGEALTLSHVCTTCVGASGLAFAAPVGTLPVPACDLSFETPVTATPIAHAASSSLRYLARAPPPVL